MLIAVHRQEGSSIPIYLQGLTMGLAYVAPIGAQNLFMIQTAMGNDRKRAFLTALIFFASTRRWASPASSGRAR